MKKEMLINASQPEECRIAILEDGLLEELYVERANQESYVGNIYKGRIVNIEPSIQAAFVDFGVGRNGFLHLSDIDPVYYKHLLPQHIQDEMNAEDEERAEAAPPRPQRPGPRPGAEAAGRPPGRSGRGPAPPSRTWRTCRRTTSGWRCGPDEHGVCPAGAGPRGRRRVRRRPGRVAAGTPNPAAATRRHRPPRAWNWSSNGCRQPRYVPPPAAGRRAERRRRVRVRRRAGRRRAGDAEAGPGHRVGRTRHRGGRAGRPPRRRRRSRRRPAAKKKDDAPAEGGRQAEGPSQEEGRRRQRRSRCRCPSAERRTLPEDDEFGGEAAALLHRRAGRPTSTPTPRTTASSRRPTTTPWSRRRWTPRWASATTSWGTRTTPRRA